MECERVHMRAHLQSRSRDVFRAELLNAYGLDAVRILLTRGDVRLRIKQVHMIYDPKDPSMKL